ncbi:unnamed protein product, partial [Phaeothamnion confervicola]
MPRALAFAAFACCAGNGAGWLPAPSMAGARGTSGWEASRLALTQAPQGPQPVEAGATRHPRRWNRLMLEASASEGPSFTNPFAPWPSSFRWETLLPTLKTTRKGVTVNAAVAAPTVGKNTKAKSTTGASEGGRSGGPMLDPDCRPELNSSAPEPSPTKASPNNDDEVDAAAAAAAAADKMEALEAAAVSAAAANASATADADRYKIRCVLLETKLLDLRAALAEERKTGARLRESLKGDLTAATATATAAGARAAAAAAAAEADAARRATE